MPSTTLRGAAAIVGACDLASPTGELDASARALEGRMVREALAEAGLSLEDVDGVCCANGFMASMELAEYLGIEPTYTDSTQIGGSSYEAHVEHAAAAIAAGACEVVVVAHAGTPRSARKRGERSWRPGRGAVMGSPQAEWELPYGLPMPVGSYALAASRHMAVYGTTSEELAEIAVSTRAWASRNPNARYRDPITVEDVLSSPMICEPLHRLDCCLVTDGAGAVVLTSAERARDLAKPPVYVLGAASAHTHSMISQMPDLTRTAGAASGPKAMRMAGVTPGDVDVLETYDSFTITALLAVEDLGFCEKGEGGAFVAGGRTGPGGDFPMNTNGGGLSYTHPGMYGIFVLVEATRQLRGEAGERQVPDAKVAVANGCGGVLSSMSTVVLGTGETL